MNNDQKREYLVPDENTVQSISKMFSEFAEEQNLREENLKNLREELKKEFQKSRDEEQKSYNRGVGRTYLFCMVPALSGVIFESYYLLAFSSILTIFSWFNIINNTLRIISRK